MIHEIASRLGLTVKSIDPNGYARTIEDFVWDAEGRRGISKNLTLRLCKHDAITINGIDARGVMSEVINSHE